MIISICCGVEFATGDGLCSACRKLTDAVSVGHLADHDARVRGDERETMGRELSAAISWPSIQVQQPDGSLRGYVAADLIDAAIRRAICLAAARVPPIEGRQVGRVCPTCNGRGWLPSPRDVPPVAACPDCDGRAP